MHCASCHNEIAPGTKFCPECGVPVRGSESGTSSTDITLVDAETEAVHEPADHTLVDEQDNTRGASPPALGASSGLQHYHIIEEVGRGGMSVVYRARDRRLHRDVAIKRILPENVSDTVAVQRLQTEARAIAAVRHPNIAAIYDSGQDEHGPYLVMEYVTGPGGIPETLKQRIQRAGPLDVDHAVKLVLTLSRAVQAAHDKGIIHRDIKPANVLLNGTDQPTLVDFDIARANEKAIGQERPGLTVVGTALGTPDFMAPEQERDALSATEQSDIYALGGLLYFCLTGRTMRHFRDTEIPEALLPVLLRATAPDPAERPACCTELAELLQGAYGPRVDAAAPQAQNSICPDCHASNAADALFCATCGMELGIACPECDTTIPPGKRFCTSCGTDAVLFYGAFAVAEKMEELQAEHAWEQVLKKRLELPEQLSLKGSKGRVLCTRIEQATGRAQKAINDIGSAREHLLQALKKERYADARDAAQKLHALSPDGPARTDIQDLLDTALPILLALEQLRRSMHLRKHDQSVRLLSLVENGIDTLTSTRNALVADNLDANSLREELDNRRRTLQAQRTHGRELLEKTTTACSAKRLRAAENAVKELTSVDPDCPDLRRLLARIDTWRRTVAGKLTAAEQALTVTARLRSARRLSQEVLQLDVENERAVAIQNQAERGLRRRRIVVAAVIGVPVALLGAVACSEAYGRYARSARYQRHMARGRDALNRDDRDKAWTHFEAALRVRGYAADECALTGCAKAILQNALADAEAATAREEWVAVCAAEPPIDPRLAEQGGLRPLLESIRKRVEEARNELRPRVNVRVLAGDRVVEGATVSFIPGGTAQDDATPVSGTTPCTLELATDNTYTVHVALPGEPDSAADLRPTLWSSRYHGARELTLRLPPRSTARRTGDPLRPAHRNSDPAAQAELMRKTGHLPVPGSPWILPEVGMRFVSVPAGHFQMGSNEGRDDEKPVHEVRFELPFWMARFEVTQEQYRTIMGENPSHFEADHHPVECVSWKQAVEFCRALNEREHQAGRLPDEYEYRLPTEAEWEYCCRAGTTTRYAWGDDPGVGNCNVENDSPFVSGNHFRHFLMRRLPTKSTTQTGSFKANTWGLYDMHGNVWEWCWDRYDMTYRDRGSPVVAPVNTEGKFRVKRGGSWSCAAMFVRSALRGWGGETYTSRDTGFRVCLGPRLSK